MIKYNSRVYTITPAIEIVGDDFVSGHLVELHSTDGFSSKLFSSKPKASIIDGIKKDNGFKTEAQGLIEKLLIEGEDD